MAKKDEKLIAMTDLFNQFKRDNLDTFNIMRIFRDNNLLETGMSATETKNFLSKLTNIEQNDLSYEYDVLIQNFLDEIENIDDLDFLGESKLKKHLN
ncbi:MAG: hypothetical protein GY817_03315 [bacterium]|nr:hypothetical protein [bacterium]